MSSHKKIIAEGIKKVGKYLTVRLSADTYHDIEDIAEETNRTKGQVGRLFLEHGFANYKQGLFKL